MDDLYRMTPAAFEFLDRKCQRHVETYRDPGADFAMMLSESGHGEYREPVGVSIRGEISMPSDRPMLPVWRVAPSGSTGRLRGCPCALRPTRRYSRTSTTFTCTSTVLQGGPCR